MTGGSFSNRSSGLSFGTSSDSDEAEPLRRRLLELGETMVACRREEAKLSQAMDQLKPAVRELEQRQAALVAERNAAHRNHGPLVDGIVSDRSGSDACKRIKPNSGSGSRPSSRNSSH